MPQRRRAPRGTPRMNGHNYRPGTTPIDFYVPNQGVLSQALGERTTRKIVSGIRVPDFNGVVYASGRSRYGQYPALFRRTHYPDYARDHYLQYHPVPRHPFQMNEPLTAS